jgi:transposase
MFIRQTKTRNSTTGEDYITFRLVASERVGKQVRQRTLLNLGRHFPLAKDEWPQLCTRIEQILSGQGSLLPEPAVIETLAQRYAARLVAGRSSIAPEPESSAVEYQDVDVNTLELVRPRSVGVEHAGLAALSWLGISDLLKSVGMNAGQSACALGSIIGRMACPGSELSTWHWLQNRSAFGELVDVDFEGVPLMRLYRASDLLVRNREAIEGALFRRINDLFSLPATVTLYDLTNTYFEGEASGNAKAKQGHSKEKRSECPLVTLGLVLDGSGFVRRSRMFQGNVSEAGTLGTLEGMLKGLDAPEGAMVIMDRGIATETNVSWLIEHNFRYLVVSRERSRRFDASQATETSTAKEETIKIQRVLSDDGKEVRLYCYSEKRQEKETGMTRRFTEHFEQGLAKLAAGLEKPRGNKNRDKLLEKIGRLKEKSHGIGQHYTITTTCDESGTKAIALMWEETPVDGTQLTRPGVYCLRSNELTWDEAMLWRTYTMLTDLEAVFRSLKSELGLRPILHQKEERTEGHLFITVLAYQAVQAIRNKLKAHGISTSWTTLRETLSVQQRVTATFKQRDGRTLNIRKATIAEKNLKEIYEKLGISATPGGIQKLTM